MTPSAPRSVERHVALVGMPGSGKTEVGRRLAASLGRPFVDLDVCIAEREGRTVAELFDERGEAGFRVAERAALTSVLAGDAAVVVATGGGAVTVAGNREALTARATVVWLRTTVAELAPRLEGDTARPLLAGGDPATVLARLAAEREAHYRTVADITVDTDGHEPDAVAAAVLEALP